MRSVLGLFALAALSTLSGQVPKNLPPVVTVEQPDAQRTRDQLSNLLEHYPPTLKNVFALDPTLLSNESYLAPYPALVSFLNAHPEIARSPSYYIPPSYNRESRQDNSTATERAWAHLLDNLEVFASFGMAIGLVTWLIRTMLDYRRWNRLTKVQTDVHTKLLDRFAGNDELLAYIKSPAGSRFLESSPITLDAGPRSVGAPLGRILWSVQAGLVSIAGGIGMAVVACPSRG